MSAHGADVAVGGVSTPRGPFVETLLSLAAPALVISLIIPGTVTGVRDVGEKEKARHIDRGTFVVVCCKADMVNVFGSL